MALSAAPEYPPWAQPTLVISRWLFSKSAKHWEVHYHLKEGVSQVAMINNLPSDSWFIRMCSCNQMNTNLVFNQLHDRPVDCSL